MKMTIIAAATAAFALAPLAAHAQASGEKMQGSPNAAGMSKSDKADPASPTSEREGSAKVKGPPNANGAAETGNDKH